MADEENLTPGIDLHHPLRDWTFRRTLESSVFWSWYETIKAWGAKHAYEMAAESALATTGELADDERTALRRWIQMIEWHGDRRADRATHTLRVSYERLVNGDWNRHTAARFATNMLGRKISESTWREAVNRWAKEQGLPKPTLPRGRPVKDKPQDS